MAKFKAPVIHEVTNVELKRPAISHLDNGIPLYDSRIGTNEVLKLELSFQNGRPFEHKKLASRYTPSLLKTGTKKYTSKKIAETFDYYGATLRTMSNLDSSRVIIFTLKKHFEKLLPVLTDMLLQPTFPQDELETYRNRAKQQLKIDLTKNDTVAYRQVTEKIFGSKHYYGYNSDVAMHEAITREDVVAHFEDTFGSNNATLFVSGMTDDKIIKKLNKTIGTILSEKAERSKADFKIPHLPKRQKIKMEGSVQTAVRIGRHLFNRHHPDFPGMFVLSTVLGGYFGSRLMSTIREEKGYTYNVFSYLDPFRFDGYFQIGTEVGNEYLKDTIKCIYAEMDKLCNEPVDADELKMVRRYLMGNLLTNVDGAFSTSGVIRTMITNDMPLEHFDKMVETFRTITAADLQALAQKYFRKEKMWEVLVG